MHSFIDHIPHIIAPELLAQARAFIDTHSKFVITAHISPDGDAIGSVLGMKQYLEAKGKEAKVVLNDAPGNNLSFIPGYRSDVIVFDNQNDGSPSQRDEAISAIQQSDAMICLDFNAISRLGGMKDLWMNHPAPKLLLDHHLGPELEHFDICISHPELAATCDSSIDSSSNWAMTTCSTSRLQPRSSAD